jgi:beta-lactamase regulating signal transducer with metallopeptidase domain
MCANQIIGSRGFIAWFEAVIYVYVRKACKNIFIKILTHSIGLIFMIKGMFYLITTMPSFISIVGMFLMFIGFFIFMIPMGA